MTGPGGRPFIKERRSPLDKRPTLKDIEETGKIISPYVTRTPLYHYRALDAMLEAEVYVKHENHQRLGAFKVRGAVSVVSRLTDEEKKRGLVVSSTGNFGQGVAYAAGIFGVAANVVVPTDVNPGKAESMRLLGANLILYGEEFDEAREHAERLAAKEGYRYVHSANEPLLTAGAGTYTLEIIEDLPDVEAIIVPVGGGSGACGACIVAKSINPAIQVIGVQSEKAPGAYLSWKQGEIVEAPMQTSAEGLATRQGYEFTQAILTEMLDDFVLVSEDELNQAVVLHLEKTHSLTEHAGAASLAAAIKIKDRVRGKKLALVASGGNISPDQLRVALGMTGTWEIDRGDGLGRE